MQHNYLKTGKLMLGMALLLISTGIFAQPGFGFRQDSAFFQGRGMYMRNGLNLTEEQENKIQELRTAHQKEVTDIQNELAVKRAELQKLRSAEDSDIEEITDVLEEIGNLTTEISKKNAVLENDIMNLLTDEQKAAYRLRRFSRSFGRLGNRFDWWPDRRRFDMLPILPRGGNMRRNGRL